MPPVDYSELSDEEAQLRFEELTSSSPERVAWLRQEVGDVLDLTPESLVPLWEWFVRREGARKDRDGELPGMVRAGPARARLAAAFAGHAPRCRRDGALLRRRGPAQRP